MHLHIDLQKLFDKYFGSKPYILSDNGETHDDENPYRIFSSRQDVLNGKIRGTPLKETYEGVEIWLPTRIKHMGQEVIYLPYSVIKIQGKKNIVKTTVRDRKGTVKELYNIDDYKITIKGFLIDRSLNFPEKQIENLKRVFELNASIELENALTDIILYDSGVNPYELYRVVITGLTFPEVEGGRKNVRPFVMELESDSIFILEEE